MCAVLAGLYVGTLVLSATRRFFALTVPVAAFVPYVAEALWIFAFPLARMSFVWFFDKESDEPG